MFDALVALLVLLAYAVPLPACIAAFVFARRWRLQGAPPGVPRVLSARPLGLIGLVLCVVVGIAGFQVPLTSLGNTGGNLLAIVLMAFVCVGAAFGAASFAQGRARWAGALAIAIAAAEWLAGGVVLFMSNVGTGMPGRPLRRGGLPLLPRVRRGRSRMDRLDDASLVAALTAESRRALASAWEEDARYEASSVPAFEHLALDLEVACAPRRLIAWARCAANEEVAHASLCFALASAYAGRDIAASPRPFAPPWVRRAETRSALLERLALDALLDGCIGEEAAALGAAHGAERAENLVVKSVLGRIAREERTHAELAWAIVEWALGEAPHLASLLSSRATQPTLARDEPAEVAADGYLASHGRISSRERATHLWKACTQAESRFRSRFVFSVPAIRSTERQRKTASAR